MKIHMLVLFLTLGFLSYSQNLIPNSSFENGNDNNPGSYNSGLEGVDNWDNFNTSDWIENGDPIQRFGLLPLIAFAANGTRCIGLGSCEGGQVKLSLGNSDIIYAYKLALKFRPRELCDTRLNVFLMDKKAEGIDNCYLPNINSLYHEIIEINSADHNPDNWYQFESEYHQAFPSNNFKHFAIKGENIPGDFGSNKYILVDDIVFERYPYCHHPCAGNQSTPIQAQWAVQDENGNITEHYGDVQNGMSDLVGNNRPLIVSLVGANYVKLIVANRWGETDEWEYFNPNGLTNADYDVNGLTNNNLKSFLQNRPDLFTVMWDGTINGNLYPNTDVYTIRLIAKGCGVGSYEEVFNDVVNTISNTNLVPPYNNNYVINNDCCEPGGRIVNQSGDEYLFYQDYIKVDDGYDLAAGQIAEHFAGNFIEILPEVTIDKESNYEASISICNKSENKTEPIHKTSGTTLLVKQSLNEPIKLVPNPANEVVFAVAPNQHIKQTQVFDQFGRLLDLPVEIVSAPKMKIDISKLSAGLYIVEILTDLETVRLKLIVK